MHQLVFKCIAALRCNLTRLSKPQKRLLILKLDSIGDYILFRNFIAAVRYSKQYKNYQLTICGNSWWKDIAVCLDAKEVDDFIWVDYNKMTNWEYKYKVIGTIIAKHFETIIHPTYSRDEFGDEIIKYSGVKNCIGYDGDFTNISAARRSKYDPFYSLLIKGDATTQFEFYRYKHFFEALLGEHLDTIAPLIDLETSEGNCIVICPGAKDEQRRWSTSNFTGLIKKILAFDSTTAIVLCGGPSEKEIGTAINSAIDFKAKDLIGKIDLPQFMNVLANAKLVITNDSGPFHIANALNKKVICLSNGTNYKRFTPYPVAMKKNSIVIYSKEGYIEDINLISIETVFEAIEHVKT